MPPRARVRIAFASSALVLLATCYKPLASQFDNIYAIQCVSSAVFVLSTVALIAEEHDE